MNFSRTRTLVAAGVFLTTASLCEAQHFPLKPGEWKISTKAEGAGDPIEMLFCLNDETWMKALTQNPTCKIEELNVTSKSIHYRMDCSGKTMQLKGPVDLTFDGMEHMTGKATVELTVGGKTTTSVSIVDYRWKAVACTAADVNTKKK